MKKSLFALAFAAFFVTGAVAIAEKDDAKKEPAKCPVSGKPVDESVFIEINGEKVQFCCKGCPKAYEKKIGVVDKGPEKCPLSGGPAKAETRLIHAKAKVVAFCCNNCAGKWAKENKIAAKDAGAEGKKCPVSGKPASADHALTINGEKTYFCCAGCSKSYLTKKLGVDAKAASETPACPYSGKPGKEETQQVHVTYTAQYFCCEKCQAKYADKNFPKKAEKKS